MADPLFQSSSRFYTPEALRDGRGFNTLAGPGRVTRNRATAPPPLYHVAPGSYWNGSAWVQLPLTNGDASGFSAHSIALPSAAGRDNALTQVIATGDVRASDKLAASWTIAGGAFATLVDTRPGCARHGRSSWMQMRWMIAAGQASPNTQFVVPGNSELAGWVASATKVPTDPGDWSGPITVPIEHVSPTGIVTTIVTLTFTQPQSASARPMSPLSLVTPGRLRTGTITYGAGSTTITELYVCLEMVA